MTSRRPEEPTTPQEPTAPDVHHPADADLAEGGEGTADAAGAVAHPDDATHMDAHTAMSDDDHGHAEPRLGPIDWPAWGFAALGVAAGVIVVALFYVAVS